MECDKRRMMNMAKHQSYPRQQGDDEHRKAMYRSTVSFSWMCGLQQKPTAAILVTRPCLARGEEDGEERLEPALNRSHLPDNTCLSAVMLLERLRNPGKT